jgi:hypothetical protein
MKRHLGFVLPAFNLLSTHQYITTAWWFNCPKPRQRKLSMLASLNDRREFLRHIPILLGVGSAASTLLPCANAVTMKPPENESAIFQTGQLLTPVEARKRFQQGQASLQYLMNHYDEICLGGGDNVRRYLGTVGTSSGLYGLAKVMRSLQDEAEDLVDFTELQTEIETSIQQANGSAYMAIFVSTSTSGVPPEKYFRDALIEIKRASKGMDEMSALLSMDSSHER